MCQPMLTTPVSIHMCRPLRRWTLTKSLLHFFQWFALFSLFCLIHLFNLAWLVLRDWAMCVKDFSLSLLWGQRISHQHASPYSGTVPASQSKCQGGIQVSRIIQSPLNVFATNFKLLPHIVCASPTQRACQIHITTLDCALPGEHVNSENT